MMNTWKKAGALFFTGVFAFGMCMGVSAEEQTDVVVFAAASMTETLTEIQEMYKEVEPNVNLVFTFDSSGFQRRISAEYPWSFAHPLGKFRPPDSSSVPMSLHSSRTGIDPPVQPGQ